MGRSESRLLSGEVLIEILTAEKVATGTAVAFRRGVKVVQVCGHLGNAKAAVLALRWQLVVAANQPGFLIVTDNGRSRHRRYVTGCRSSQIESPNRLRGNIRVRSESEIGVCPDALDVIFLRRVLGKELKEIRSRPQHAVVLAATFVRKTGRRIDGVERKLLWWRAERQPRI